MTNERHKSSDRTLTRRSFLVAAISSSALAFGTAARAGAARGGKKLHNKIGIRADMVPPHLSTLEGFKLARASGFQQMQVFTTFDESVIRENKAAAQASGIEIDSVANSLTNWRDPLSSSDPDVVKAALAAQAETLRSAKFYGAEATLVIPGVVTPAITYRDAWRESRKHIEQLIPLAETLKIVMALEETANQSKFLLSPLEFARYLDDFQSPYVKSYFDTANVMPIGYPQDWIHTLGHRIAKVHIKDYDPKTRQFVMPGDGAVDWPAVRQAFIDVDYSGTFTAELPPRYCRTLAPGYLRELSERMDRFLL